MKLHSCYFPANRIQHNNTAVQPNSCFLNKKKIFLQLSLFAEVKHLPSFPQRSSRSQNSDTGSLVESRQRKDPESVQSHPPFTAPLTPLPEVEQWQQKSPGSELCLFGIYGIYETCMLVMKTSTEPSQGVRTQAGMCVCTQRTEACECRSASRCSLAWTSAYKRHMCVKRA